MEEGIKVKRINSIGSDFKISRCRYIRKLLKFYIVLRG